MQHHPHHQQAPPPSHLQHRPPSIVHQQHQAAPPPPGYPSSNYPPPPNSTNNTPNTPQDGLPYYPANQYSAASAPSGYTSAQGKSRLHLGRVSFVSQSQPTNIPRPDQTDMMATAVPRNSYLQSYHTSNSPASVASPSGHDQRNMYGQHSQQPLQQQMHQSYYPQPPQQQQYGSLPQSTMGQQAAAPSPYAQHTPQPQPSMMMSHQPHQPHQMAQHPSQHTQAAMTASPRHPQKIETHQQVPQMQRQSASGQIGGPSPSAQNGAQLSTPTGSTSGVNPNAAPGPIPATTPLVVRQDGNGVQWIAFEYSRDRVKMEYTIRCDVESVDTDQLKPEFKTENCVYPRACCPKDQYRGNRLQYETECNTVGWALAQLNPPLRGKRGLIQRAVDSWRNSNQDPRLRSRRVRRMAKMNVRKGAQPTTPSHMGGPGGPAGMSAGPMGPGGSASMGKPGMSMGGHMNHGNPDGHHGGDEVGMYQM